MLRSYSVDVLIVFLWTTYSSIFLCNVESSGTAQYADFIIAEE